MIEEQPVTDVKRVSPFVWLIVAALLLCQAAVCVVGRAPALGGKVDLRAFYAAGAIIRSGHGAQLYNYEYQEQVQNALIGPRVGALPFLYPAFAALPFIPLSSMSYRAAFFVLLIFNILLMMLAALLLHAWLPWFQRRSWLVLVAFYGCVFGVSVALMQGQISFLLLAVYCGTWVLLRRGSPLLAGLLMSLALMKFQTALPVLLLFCVWKQWRFAGGFLCGAVGLAGVSLAMIGRVGAVGYWQSMSGMVAQTALHADAARSHYGMFPVDMPNLHGLTFGISHGASWGLVLNVVLSVGVLIFAARQRTSLLVALPAAMLVSYHMQPHDLTLLLLPLSFEMDCQLRRKAAGSAGKVLLMSVLLLVLPLAGVLMTLKLNYLVSLAVGGVMWVAATMKPEGITGEAAAYSPAVE